MKTNNETREMNIVEKAVSHLKDEAVERATQNAVELIDTVLAELEAADWDLNVAAPRAKNVYDRKTYVSMNAKHTLYGSIATYTKTSLSRNRPILRVDIVLGCIIFSITSACSGINMDMVIIFRVLFVI